MMQIVKRSSMYVWIKTIYRRLYATVPEAFLDAGRYTRFLRAQGLLESKHVYSLKDNEKGELTLLICLTRYKLKKRCIEK